MNFQSCSAHIFLVYNSSHDVYARLRAFSRSRQFTFHCWPSVGRVMHIFLSLCLFKLNFISLSVLPTVFFSFYIRLHYFCIPPLCTVTSMASAQRRATRCFICTTVATWCSWRHADTAKVGANCRIRVATRIIASTTGKSHRFVCVCHDQQRHVSAAAAGALCAPRMLRMHVIVCVTCYAQYTYIYMVYMFVLIKSVPPTKCVWLGLMLHIVW